MKPCPSLDDSILQLVRTSSFTEENSSPGPSYGYEMGILFKATWIFSQLPPSTSIEINSSRSLVKYVKTQSLKTFVCFGHLILSRGIWSHMPHELVVVKTLTNILHCKPNLTVEGLQKVINNDGMVKNRLRDKTSTHTFLYLYSDYFVIEENGVARALIKSHFMNDYERKHTTKVNTLVVIELIQGFISRQKKQNSSHINLPKMYAHLQSLGFFVSVTELDKFMQRFYQRSKLSAWTKPLNIEPSRILDMFECHAVEMINDTLRQWPISLDYIQTMLTTQGVTLNHNKLTFLIGAHFPDYKIQDGVVFQNHEPYLGQVQVILNERCPIFIEEIQTDLSLQGISLSRIFLSELVVRSLDDYFIHKGQIYRPTSSHVEGDLMATSVLRELDSMLKNNGPMLLHDLVLQLATKGTALTCFKLKTIIHEYSNSYVSLGNCVSLKEGQGQGINLQFGAPHTEVELKTHVKSFSSHGNCNFMPDFNEEQFDHVVILKGHDEVHRLPQNTFSTEERAGGTHDLPSQSAWSSDELFTSQESSSSSLGTFEVLVNRLGNLRNTLATIPEVLDAESDSDSEESPLVTTNSNEGKNDMGTDDVMHNQNGLTSNFNEILEVVVDTMITGNQELLSTNLLEEEDLIETSDDYEEMPMNESLIAPQSGGFVQQIEDCVRLERIRKEMNVERNCIDQDLHEFDLKIEEALEMTADWSNFKDLEDLRSELLIKEAIKSSQERAKRVSFVSSGQLRQQEARINQRTCCILM